MDPRLTGVPHVAELTRLRAADKGAENDKRAQNQEREPVACHVAPPPKVVWSAEG